MSDDDDDWNHCQEKNNSSLSKRTAAARPRKRHHHFNTKTSLKSCVCMFITSILSNNSRLSQWDRDHRERYHKRDRQLQLNRWLKNSNNNLDWKTTSQLFWRQFSWSFYFLILSSSVLGHFGCERHFEWLWKTCDDDDDVLSVEARFDFWCQNHDSFTVVDSIFESFRVHLFLIIPVSWRTSDCNYHDKTCIFSIEKTIRREWSHERRKFFTSNSHIIQG